MKNYDSVELSSIDRQLSELPAGLTIFEPFLKHEAKESIESGGEVFVSEDSSGKKDGLFIYDPYEETGTIFTKSRESFELFLRLRPHSYIFSEFLAEDYQRDVWNIWQLDINNVQSGHRFRYVVSIEYDADEIERFMMSTQPETNRRWIRVALNNGDKCFVVKISGRIVGMAWLTIAGDMARSHSVYVEPQFRRMGVMTDNLQARLIYLKSRGVKTLINEIAESNVASSGHAIKGGERMIGKMFLYNSQSDPET